MPELGLGGVAVDGEEVGAEGEVDGTPGLGFALEWGCWVGMWKLEVGARYLCLSCALEDLA